MESRRTIVRLQGTRKLSQPTGLHAHLHRNSRVRVVFFNDKVLGYKVVNVLYTPRKADLGKGAWLTLELYLKRVDVVTVDVCIAELDD